MKKRIFALALALCMMLSVMPTSLAVDGVLTSGGGSSSLTLTSGGSTVSRVTSGSAQPRQDGVLYGSGNEGGTTPVVDPVVDTSGALDGGENVKSGEVFTKLTNDNDPPTGGSGLNTSPNNGLELKKTVSEAGDKITLEAWVTGEEVTVTVKEGEPVEIVLVLDRSARMLANADNGKTKMENLKAAATDFLTAVQAKSPKSRVALVSYANKNTSTVDSGTKTTAIGALVPITKTNTNTQAEELNSDLTNAINALSASGNAYSDEALGKATRILQDLNAKEPTNNHKRIVILFTAGIPGEGSWNNNDNAYSVAQASIHWGTILKANKNDTLSIGSDSSYDIDLSQQFYSYYSRTNANVFNSTEKGCSANIFCVGIDLVANTGSSSDGAKINEYLYRVSSHRRDGSHVGDVTDLGFLGKYDGRDIQNAWEEEHEDWSYNYPDIYTRGNVANSRVTGIKYFQTGDIADIGNMFTEISNDITTGGSSNESLTTETVVKDVISPYFQIPADGTVTAYSLAYAGNNAWDGTASKTYAPTITGNTVTVDGFNFTENWVGINTATGKAHGQKLVIEIAIEPKTGFLGGQGIPTNDNTQAGVYLNGTLVENFPSAGAKTDIAISDVTVDIKDKNVYLSNKMSDAEMLAGAVVKIGDVELDLKKENFGLEEWQYAFLSKIEVVSTESDGSFKATCTVTDKAANTKSGEDSASVNVFKPHITFKDSTIYLGEKADYSKNNGSPLVVWKNGQTSSDDAGVTMTGNKPSVDVDYSIEKQEELYFTGCTDISITKVSLNEDDKDYKANTTFWNGKTKTNDSHQFTVHVVKPVFSNSDATIYLSNKINLNDLMQVKEDWVCDSKCNDKQSLKNADVPNTITIDHSFSVNNVTVADELAPEDCATYTVTTTVNGLPVQSEAQVKVHVVKPEITNDDTAIYLGNTVDLNTLVTEEGDAWTCNETGNDKVFLAINAEGSRIAPAVDHSFKDTAVINTETRYQPETCTPVTFTTTVTSDVSKAATPEDSDFTVHVHVPQFTVTAQDLWADYGADVYLYNDTDTDAVVNIAQSWVDRKSDDDTLTATGDDEMNISDILFNVDDSYTMGEADVDVNIIKVEADVNGEDYAAVKAGSTEDGDERLSVTKAVAEENHDFTIHINKFKAVITNNGTQNAIYTLGDNIKVAVEAGKSATVAGLICGKEYTISESADNDWTWRYEAAATTEDKVACTVGSVKNEPTDSSVNVGMNYGEKTNSKWLSGEDCVVNKLNVNGKAIALPAKKEEEVDA